MLPLISKKASMLQYPKVFFSFVMIVLATNVALSSLMYFNYERHSLNVVQNYTVEELSQVSYSNHFMFEAAKLTLQQLYFNPAALKLMNYDDLGELESAELLEQVGIVNINLPFVNSIYMYNRKAQKMYYDGKIFPSAAFPDQEIVRLLNEDGKLKSLQPIARKISAPVNYTNWLSSSEQIDNVYTFVFFDSHSNQIDNAIILNVSQEWLKNTIDSMSPATSGETLIAAADGTITLSRNKAFPYMDNIFDTVDLSDIWSKEGQSGYTVKTIEGQKVLVSYVSTARDDWKYLRFTPYHVVYGKLKQMLVITIAIFSLVTLLSLVAVALGSKSVHSFFNKKMSDMEKRFTASKHADYDKKQQFLRLLASRVPDEEKLKERLARHHIHFNLELNFLTVVMQVDRYQEFCKQYTPDDQALLTYAIVNIAGELAAPHIVHEVADLGDGCIGILVNLSSDDDETAMMKLEGLVRLIQSKVAEHLHLSLSVSLGEMLEDISEIPGSIDECKKALDYKLFDGMGAVLYASTIREYNKKDYMFPEALMPALVERLLAGELEAVRRLCQDFVESARGYSIASLQTAVLQMAHELKEALKPYQVLAGELQYNRFITIANKAAEHETLDEITVQLSELLESIPAALSRSREKLKQMERHSGILEHVEQFLEQQFHNPELNSDLVAEHLGMTSKYLRTVYKKAAGESLGERINQYRLNRAKILLEDSEVPVHEIAAQTGFSNPNYFFTLFRKYNGVTPSEYRALKLAEKE